MYAKRLQKLRAAMKKKSLDGAFLIGDANRNYLSGFTGNESYSVITQDRAIFITDSRFTEQARIQVKDYELKEYKSNIMDFLSDLVKEINIKTLGFEEDIISYANYNLLNEKTSCEVTPLNGMVEAIRIIKDESEIQSLRKAACIADKAFEHMISFIKAGMTEIEVAIELEFFMKKLGAKALSFPSIVASGFRSSLPHGEPTDKIIKSGEFLTLDYGCIFEEYCSDMTRTFIVGESNSKLLDIYTTVLKAQELALQAIKPGLRACNLDKIARDYIESKGYGKYFGHGLGHGVGREVHEAPRINKKSEVVLETGMVITDEPGIYIPELGGVRIEDLVVVTKNGYEVLSKSTKELIIL